MDTLIKSTLLSSVSAGGRVKAPRQPNIWCGSADYGYIPGDLVDANGLAEFILNNDIIHDDPEFQALREEIERVDKKLDDVVGGDLPETLDTLKEIAEAFGDDPEAITKMQERITTVETTLNNIDVRVSGHTLILNI